MPGYDDIFKELWGVVTTSAQKLLDDEGDHVKAKMRELVEYAAHARLVIATTSDPVRKELAEREYAHRTAQIESEMGLLGLEATKRSRLVGLLEGVFGIAIKYVPMLLKLA